MATTRSRRCTTFFLLASLLLALSPVSAYGNASPAPGVRDAIEQKPATLPSDIPNNWWAAAQEDIRHSEYQVTRQDRTNLSEVSPAYQAPNRANNYRTYFTPAGIRVIPRDTDGSTPGWEWGLSLRGFGHEGNPTPLTSSSAEEAPDALSQPAVSGNRVEYQYGDLVEWYVNDERGLEQGFTLNRPPTSSPSRAADESAAPQPSGALALDLALSGNLTPSLSEDGQAIEFITSDGTPVLRYDGLHVYDATGRELAARFEVYPAGEGDHDLQVKILFDVTDAAYPITVDPLVTSPAWTGESNQQYANFGWSVGTAGDVNGDGYSDVIVGAPYYDNGQDNEGRAFVFHGSATGLSAAANWFAEIDEVVAFFGYAVATAGDVNGDGYSDVIVGTSYRTEVLQDAKGKAYVYYGSSTGLWATPAWTGRAIRRLPGLVARSPRPAM